MVSDHEKLQIATAPDDDYDRQMERRVDQGVYTPYGAAADVLDFDPHRDQSVVRDLQAAAAARHPKPHYSRRGGRSFPESDRDIDLLGGTAVEMTDEEREVAQDGADLVRDLIRGHSLRRAALSGKQSEVRRVITLQRRDDDGRGSH